MTKSRMMDPRYAKAIKSTEELFTPIELQEMGIDPENMIKTTSCNPYFETNYKEKNKLKNTFIKNSEAGLYEFFAKEVECSQDFINQKRRLKESFGKTKGFYDEQQKKEQLRKLVEYEKDMDLLFRNLSRICQNKAKGLCGIRDKSNDVYSKENLKQILIDEKGGDDFVEENDLEEIEQKVNNLDDEQVIEAIKTRNPRFKELLKLDDEELGSGRKMLLMLNGFEKVGQGWKYSKKLEEKFIKAASICRNNYFCVKSEFSDIPKEIGRFTKEIVNGITTPYDVMYSKSMKMFGISKQKAIERQQEKKQKSDDKIKKLNKEKKELAKKKQEAKDVLDNPNASASNKIKAQAKVDKIEKREKSINEGTRGTKSIKQLELNKVNAQKKIEKKELEQTKIKEKEQTPYSFIRNRGTKTQEQKLKEQARQEKFKKIKEEKRKEQLELLKAKNATVGLTTAQARKRDRTEYRLNPSQASSLKRFRAEQGRKELTKLQELQKQGQLTQTQKDRLKDLIKKPETKGEKINRLSKERVNLLTKKEQRDLSSKEQKRLNRINKGTRFTRKKSLGRLQGKTKLNKVDKRKRDELNALRQRQSLLGEKVNYTKKEAKLQRNLNKLQTKKNKRNNLVKTQRERALTFRERSKLRGLEGTRPIGFKSQQKKQREQEAIAGRLEALQQKQLRGEKLSSSNRNKLYGKSLYKKSGLTKKEAQDAKLKHLNKALREGSFDYRKRDKKRYRQLQTKKLKREGIKNKSTRKLERKSREYNALKMGESQSKLSNYGVKRLKALEKGAYGKNSLTQLAEKQAQRNINKIKKNVEAPGLLGPSPENNTEA